MLPMWKQAGLLMGLLLSLSGCVLRAVHEKALLDLQEQGSRNYSQQVLDAIVNIRQRSELPTFFYFEGASSIWNPSLSSSISGNISTVLSGPGLVTPDVATITPSLGANDNLSNAVQMNDFGPAAMSRISAIYAFLTYPIHIGESQLPHGALFTTVREADRSDEFILWTKTPEGRYLGVTPETQFEFFKLTRDIIYWSRHEAPNPADLESTAGILYAFFSQYPTTELALNNALSAAEAAKTGLTEALSEYRETDKKVTQLEQDFKKSKDNIDVLTLILQEAYEQRKLQQNQLGQVGSQKSTADAEATAQRFKIEGLLQQLEQAASLIKAADPQGSEIDVAAILRPFRARVNGLLARDPAVIQEVASQEPSTSGLNARDPVDKLYRDRYEALPIVPDRERFFRVPQ
jgi:hypothetical protein